jgi:hypothetical protein
MVVRGVPASKTEVCWYGGGVEKGKERKIRGGREEEKEKGKKQSDGRKRKRGVDDEEKKMVEGIDWEEFMVHRVMRVDSGMKVAKRDLVGLRSKLADLQEETAGSFEELWKGLKVLRKENAELHRGIKIIIEENRAMGGWLQGILCWLEEKLEVEARNEPEGSDTEKKKKREADEEEEEEEKKGPETEKGGAKDAGRVAEDKEKEDGNVEMATVE